LRATIEDRLSAERIERAGVLDANAVGAVLARHVSGHEENGRLLWTILGLQMWAETWRAPGGCRSMAEHSDEEFGQTTQRSGAKSVTLVR
jgi:hypothetical protein